MTTTLGFGAAVIAGLHRWVDEETALEAVNTAWDLGIRYYDTAPHYGLGLSERRLGKALAQPLGQHGNRFLTQWCTSLLPPFSFAT